MFYYLILSYLILNCIYYIIMLYDLILYQRMHLGPWNHVLFNPFEHH